MEAGACTNVGVGRLKTVGRVGGGRIEPNRGRAVKVVAGARTNTEGRGERVGKVRA